MKEHRTLKFGVIYWVLSAIFTLSCSESGSPKFTRQKAPSDSVTETVDHAATAELAATSTAPVPGFYRLGLPFKLFQNKPGFLTAVSVADLNNDGRQDLVFSGGRHTLKGQGWVMLQDPASGGTSVIFQNAFPFGPLGGYTGVGVVRSPSGAAGSLNLLLAGGSCKSCSSSVCYNGDRACSGSKRTPSRLFAGTLSATGLSVEPKWAEPVPGGSRSGELVMLEKDQEPSILLAGEEGFDLYSKTSSGSYGKIYNLNTTPASGRFAGIAVRPGDDSFKNPLIVLGARASNPSVVGLNIPTGATSPGLPEKKITPEVFNVQSSSTTSYEVAGVAIDDLSGTGTVDVVVANGAGSSAQIPFIYSYKKMANGQLSFSGKTAVSSSGLVGRTVTTGKFFKTSKLADIAIGTTSGEVIIFQNLSENGVLRFVKTSTIKLRTSSIGFEIRGLSPIALYDGVTGLVAAVYNPGISSGGRACSVINTPLAEAAETNLTQFPCYNAFIIYPKG